MPTTKTTCFSFYLTSPTLFATMHCSWFYTFLSLFLLITITTINSSPTPKATVSYADHCSSFVPESTTTTTRIFRGSVPYIITSYVTGEHKLFDVNQKNKIYYYVGKSLRLQIQPNYHKTVTQGIYKVEGFLSIRSPYRYYSNETDISRARDSIRFSLIGFWSEISRRLCMVGSSVDGIKTVGFEAVLKLSFASEHPNIYTGLVSGTLESASSVVSDSGYFEPIFIFHFPELSNYSYSLVSGKFGRSFDLQPTKFCSMFSSVLKMEYDGMRSPLGLSLSSRFLALNPIQCSWSERKLRFMARLQNSSYIDQEFDLESTLIGEASWDSKKKELFGVACRLLNPSDNPEHAVGDCTMRLTLEYNTIWTLRNEPKAVGQFSSTKKVDDSGYFRKVNLTSFDLSPNFPDLRYEYSELDRAKKSCPVQKPVKKGSIYPDGHSYNMRFDLSVKNSKGEEIAWGYANPISVGNDLYDSAPESASVSAPERHTNIAPTNISYKIVIHSYKVKLVNMSQNSFPQSFDITSEGVYSAENGHLCMVGCGKSTNRGRYSHHVSTDCEILLTFQFASLNDKKGGFIKGKIESVRNKSDPLRFEDMILSSAAYNGEAAERSIWRMDLETTMVLLSNTLSCVFVGLQILHVERHPELRPHISLVMLVILCLGHMILLVLNFEAVFLGSCNKQMLLVSWDGCVEANEVVIWVITMVAFLLHICLAQLVWATKRREAHEESLWAGEKMSVFVSLLLYVFGGLFSLLLTMNGYFYRKYSIWDNLRSYAGLILDGFLFPQILLTVFGCSLEKALARSFYVGMSAVRLVPHVYNQYRAQNYPTNDVNGTYKYAEPADDFYSMTWDVLISSGVIALALIVDQI